MAKSHKEIKDTLSSLENIIKSPKPLGQNFLFRKFIIPLGIRPLKSSFDTRKEKISTQTKLSQSVNKSITTADISKSKTANSTESTVKQITSHNEHIIQTSSDKEKIPQLNKALKILGSPITLNKSNINTSKSIVQKHHPMTFGSSSPQGKLLHENTAKNNHQLSSNETIRSNQARPSSWSSVAELVGDSKPTNKLSYSKSNLRNIPTILRNSIPYQSTKNNSPSSSIPAQNHSSNVTSISNNTLIQRTKNSVAEEDTVTLESQKEGEKDAQIENKKNLEVLAREIYSLVRQRLQIERERRGNSYSGRLP